MTKTDYGSGPLFFHMGVSQHDRSSRRRPYQAIFGSVFVFIGLFFCAVLWRGYTRSSETYSWIERPCLIQSAWVREETGANHHHPNYRFQVRYHYEFNGETLVGNRETLRDGPSKNRKKKEKLLELYPVGSTSVCYVNPEIPSKSVLKHETKAAGYTLWFPGLFVLGGLGMIFSGLRKRNDH